MKVNLIMLFSLLGISLFTGIIIVSIGLGAAFPAMERIAAPFVCGAEPLDLQLDHYSYKPGQSGYTITWSCARSDGSLEDVTWQIILVAGLIYSAALFLISLAGLALFRGSARSLLKVGGANRARPPALSTLQSRDPGSLRRKLKDLQELRDSGLITEQDYESKKSELLEEL